MADKPKQIRLTRPAKRFDMRAFQRLCFWGGAAIVATSVVAVTTQTNIGTQRMQAALSQTPEPARAVAAVVNIPAAIADAASENRRLAETVRSLTVDRDRLNSRIASLENTLNEVTGSIRKQAAAAPKTDPAASPLPPSLAAAPATVPATLVPPAPPFDTTTTASVAPAPEVPLPRLRVVDNPPSASDDSKPEESGGPTKTEFGIDLGGLSSLAGARARWSAAKASHGPLFAGLQPMVAVHEKKPGTTEFRLIAGPFKNAASAARLCARLAAVNAYCRPAIYEGQRLAMR